MELKDYLRILKRRWLTIVIVGGAFFGISYFYMQRQPTAYSASVEIAIKENPYQTFSGDFPALFQDYFSRATKIAMIRSRKVLEHAVTKFLTEYYGDLGADETDAPDGGQIPSRRREREAKLTAAVNQVNGALAVSQNKETEIITISFSDLNARKTLDVVNAVARAYEERASTSAGEGIDKAVALIDKIVEARDQEIKEVQFKMKKLPKTVSFTPFEIEVKQILDRVQRLTEEKDKKSVEQKLCEEQHNRLTEILKSGGVPAASGMTTPVERRADTIRMEIAAKERALEQLLRKYTEKAQAIIDARAEIVRLKSDLVVETERERRTQSVSDKLRALDACARLNEKSKELEIEIKKLDGEIAAANAEYEKKLSQPRENENREYQEMVWQKMILDNQLEYLNNSKRNLSNQKENLLINRRFIETPVERISFARDATPKPGTGTTSMPFLFVTALIIGVACAYMLEYMNTTVRTEHDVRRYVNLPTIGAIAKIREVDQRLLINTAPRSPLFEVFNTIGTILETYAAENNARVFMVASSKAEEGKSTVSTNIAVALARTGERVILIDCDLRKAVLHKFFNIDNSKGVSTYVLNQMGESPYETIPELPEKLNLDDIVRPTEIEGLKIIPAGPHPKNPVALLKSAPFRQMVSDVRGKADIVLLDVPPVSIAVDTMILAPMIDATLLLISAGETNKDEVTFAKKMIESAKGRIIGCVLNKITIESRGYYYYYYYDNYRYYRES